MEKKLVKPQVADSPISDVFEHRHPLRRRKSSGRRKLLPPRLEKSPEQPYRRAHRHPSIDEHGRRPLHHASPACPFTGSTRQADLPPKIRPRNNISAILASRLLRAAFTPLDIAASSIPCARSPASPRRRKPTSAISICSEHGGSGLSVAFDLPTLMGYDSDHPGERRRSRQVRRRDQFPRRHGNPFPRHQS